MDRRTESDGYAMAVEDIVDTGLTLNYLLKYLADKGPASVSIVCLLDKPARRLAEVPIDFRGFTIPDRFVIGCLVDGLLFGLLFFLAHGCSNKKARMRRAGSFRQRGVSSSRPS